ncbi:hypothetical protein [Alkalihalobacillus sp. CinArs1]|uniref:hypothetical protein n=1 Tax=Alkalihalobacillus sp. CinArs1 TaxID=2995314 RepID=UPI0022DD5B6F|nr:hypothetical protein [Alkalihalobacillus sp. CinArs1]
MLHTLRNNKWKFSPIPNIEESNFNKTLERFYNMGVVGLVRENIQNSLDGRLVNYDGPVVVKVKTGSIKKKYIPGIDDVEERIMSLEGRNSYTNETINHMKNKINQEKVRYISFEDINTRGLTGARNGQSNSKKDTWGIYAYNKGVHFEEENSQIEVSRGGSHGVGKIASNAASDLHVMYFANCDENGDQHLGGTVQLIEHLYKGQAYRSSGYFTDIEVYDDNKSKFYPYENTFHDVFKKDTRGLKIIIPYFRSGYDDETAIIKSICDSFFVSILNNKLEVHINEKEVNKETILDYVKDQDYYIQEIADAKKEFTPLYLDTYLDAPSQGITVSNGSEEFQFQLYFRFDERIPKGRVAIVRTIGMKIEDFKVQGSATKPFNAVLIGGPKEDAYLKSLENESHTKLSKDHFNDASLKRRATRFINNLSKEISKVIENAIKENNPTDGIMDTQDLLYVVETQFKKDLEKSIGTVKVNQGKSLVKSTTAPSKKEKRKEKDKEGREESKEKKKPKKRDPLKWQKSEEEKENNEEGKERYSAHPEMVERIILTEKEMIKFDFTKSEKLGDAKNCDIALSLIDGMGVEYKDEFKIQNNYINIIDVNSGGSCSYRKNVIKGVQINNGVAQLNLKLRDTFNRSLKFVYYVEV